MSVTEHHIQVRKTARYFTLGSIEHATELWVVCHGYEQLASAFIENFRVIEAPHRLIVAPEALNRFYPGEERGPHGPDSPVGATWMTREDRLAEIDDYVSYLDGLYTHVRTSHMNLVVVVGFSQGASTASRWLGLGAAHVDTMILWGSGPASDLGDSELRALARARAVIVHGTRDNYMTPQAAVRVAERLKNHGVDGEIVVFEGGHRLDDETLRRLAERSW